MKISAFFKKLSKDLYESLRRFPISLALSVLATIFIIILIEISPYDNSNTHSLQRIIMTLILGIPIYASLSLFFERYGKIRPFIRLLVLILTIFGLFLHYSYMLQEINPITAIIYGAVMIVAFSVFMLMPYFIRREFFEVYIIKLFTRFLITGIFTLILFGGIAAILFTLKALLQVPISQYAYPELFAACVGIFGVFYFLAGVPVYSEKFTNENYPKAFKILLLYILMPLISVYTAILYIYFVRILIVQNWPNGIVGNLVLWYSIITAIVIFFVRGLKDENKWVNLFVWWITKLIIPLIGLMFFSLWIRINAFGITENRYFAVIIGLWVLGLMIWLIFAKHPKSTVFLISLAAVALISVFGPQSSFSLSMASQNNRLENVLNKYSMISKNKIIPAKTEVSENDKQQITGILNYFEQIHSYKDVKYLPANYKSEDFEKTFGFEQMYFDRGEFNEKGIMFNYMIENRFAVDSKGYDTLFRIDSTSRDQIVKNGISVQYFESENLLKIKGNENEILNISMSDLASKLLSRKNGDKSPKGELLTASQASFEYGNKHFAVKMILQNINGWKNEGQDIRIDFIDTYLMVRQK